MTFSNSSTSRANIFVSSAMLDCNITSLCHVTKSTGATFFVLQENFERSRGRRRCIKECSTAVAQVTGALLNATRLRCCDPVLGRTDLFAVHCTAVSSVRPLAPSILYGNGLTYCYFLHTTRSPVILLL